MPFLFLVKPLVRAGNQRWELGAGVPGGEVWGELEVTEPEKGASSELTGQACSCGVRVGVGRLQGRCALTDSIAAWSICLGCVRALLLPRPLG